LKTSGDKKDKKKKKGSKKESKDTKKWVWLNSSKIKTS
jgi:hypothetical protein